MAQDHQPFAILAISVGFLSVIFFIDNCSTPAKPARINLIYEGDISS